MLDIKKSPKTTDNSLSFIENIAMEHWCSS